MTEFQRLFLVQAQSGFEVYRLLLVQPGLPECHALHYLQMATELLGKAHAWKSGQNVTSHRAFVGFLRSLATNRKAQKQLDFDGQNERWDQMIRKSVAFAQKTEDLAPALANDGPNPEYPWPTNAPTTAPAEHAFQLWEDLQGTTAGRKFLSMLTRLFASAEAFL